MASNPETSIDWQPIGTAPRDGTPILVSGGSVEWRMNYQRGTQATGDNGGWFSHSAQRFLQWDPLHWMPLPKSPEGN